MFIAFELNQDARTWTNSTGVSIPCRTTGDILISLGEHGNTPELGVERWVTETRDPSTGCARTGRLVRHRTHGRTMSREASTTVHRRSPTICQAAMAAAFPSSASPRRPSTCHACWQRSPRYCTVFGSVWMHSRSSLSENSAMQDYVAPAPFTVATCKASPQLSSSASGTISLKSRGKHRLRRTSRPARAPSALRHCHLERRHRSYGNDHVSGSSAPTTRTVRDCPYSSRQRP